ncbi:hypothetical protein AVEN_139411-1, partial [Araneus ventricosus]
ELASTAQESAENYDSSKDTSLITDEDKERKESREMIMLKGQSKRLWNELYKSFNPSVDVTVSKHGLLNFYQPHVLFHFAFVVLFFSYNVQEAIQVLLPLLVKWQV